MKPHIVLVTCSSKKEAEEIARKIVAEALAACVNVIDGVTSIYSWKDKVEESSEALMIIKTSEENLGKLEARVLALHSYEAPEFVSIPMGAVGEKYLEWMAGVLRS